MKKDKETLERDAARRTLINVAIYYSHCYDRETQSKGDLPRATKELLEAARKFAKLVD